MNDKSELCYFCWCEIKAGQKSVPIKSFHAHDKCARKVLAASRALKLVKL